MKVTPFNALHKSLGAKMVEFGGFEMPVQYAGIMEEHAAVRNAAGVFDVSHMGEFEVRGRDAVGFLQRVTVNDVSRLTEGKAQYSAMCNVDGGIVDDLLIYHFGDRYMLVVNASNIGKDFAWLKSNLKGDVELTDVSDTIALLAIQGPRSLEILQHLTQVPLREIGYYTFKRGIVAGQDAIISRTGYTGELGFEMYFAVSPDAPGVWSAIFDAGKSYGLQPVGLGARDTLRLEMGYCLYGNDIDDTTTPLQAGLGWITKLGKGEFIGKAVLDREKAAGIPRKLVGFVLPDRTIARHGYAISDGTNGIGTVTSGTFSPTLQRSVGMGYVPPSVATPGATVHVVIRGKATPATVVPLPFVQRPGNG